MDIGSIKKQHKLDVKDQVGKVMIALGVSPEEVATDFEAAFEKYKYSKIPYGIVNWFNMKKEYQAGLETLPDVL